MTKQIRKTEYYNRGQRFEKDSVTVEAVEAGRVISYREITRWDMGAPASYGQRHSTTIEKFLETYAEIDYSQL